MNLTHAPPGIPFYTHRELGNIRRPGIPGSLRVQGIRCCASAPDVLVIWILNGECLTGDNHPPLPHLDGQGPDKATPEGKAIPVVPESRSN